MCELFGVSSAVTVRVNDMMKEFVTHSEEHWNGWGIGLLFDNFVSLEKEPIQALKSTYLKERLKYKLEVKDMIAHIRLATIGTMEYENTHPFIERDNRGRLWLLAHNGTIFDCPRLEKYRENQEGNTDSERILLYLVEQMSVEQERLGRGLEFEERFALLERLVGEVSLHNKLNLLLYDGTYIYAHTNYRNSIYIYQTKETVYFATSPLSGDDWIPMPFTTLCAYRDGKCIKQGSSHGNEYIDNEADLKYLFVHYSGL